MNTKQKRVLMETKLRNLKRKYARVIQHAELTEQAIILKSEIDGLERELKLMN